MIRFLSVNSTTIIRRRRAVTLLEVILAMGILSLVTSMTYWFYAASLKTNREGTERARKLRLSRSVLNRITREIRQSTTMTTDNRQGLSGEAERIELTSFRVPSRELSKERRSRDDRPPAEYDLTRVEYKIIRHPEVEHPDGYDYPLGLSRVEAKVPRRVHAPEALLDGEEQQTQPLGDEASSFLSDLLGEDGSSASGGVDLGPRIDWDELYAPEIRYLRFCYYDGARWWDTWEVSGDSPLPQLVMVTIGYEPQLPFGESQMGLDEINEEFCTCLNEDPVECVALAPDQFSTVVRLTQSDPLFRSRISRETQDVMEQVSEGEEEETDEGGF